MRAIKASYVLLIMLLLAVTAFSMGPLFYRDSVEGTIPVAILERLRIDLVHPFKIRPFTLQVTEATVLDHDPPYSYTGKGTLRALFGVPVGEVTLVDNTWSNSFDSGRWWMVWGTFLMAEGLLCVYVVWWVRRYWW